MRKGRLTASNFGSVINAKRVSHPFGKAKDHEFIFQRAREMKEEFDTCGNKREEEAVVAKVKGKRGREDVFF